MSENNNTRILHNETSRRFMIILVMTPFLAMLSDALKPNLIMQAGAFLLVIAGADAILGLRAKKGSNPPQEVAAA